MQEEVLAKAAELQRLQAQNKELTAKSAALEAMVAATDRGLQIVSNRMAAMQVSDVVRCTANTSAVPSAGNGDNALHLDRSGSTPGSDLPTGNGSGHGIHTHVGSSGGNTGMERVGSGSRVAGSVATASSSTGPASAPATGDAGSASSESRGPPNGTGQQGPAAPSMGLNDVRVFIVRTVSQLSVLLLELEDKANDPAGEIYSGSSSTCACCSCAS